MALFSDGPPSTIDDLTQHDSYLVAVASTEGINVTNKLQLAYTELQIELTAIFAREASIYAPVLGQAPLDTNHLSISPPLKNWHLYKTLEVFYQDAYFSQLNDRYKAKWTEYQNLGASNRGRFIDTGAGLVIDPLLQPAAPVIYFQSSMQGGASAYVTVTLVNTEGEESTPAPVTPVTIPDQNTLVVSNPPAPSNAVGWNLYGGSAPNLLALQNAVPMPLGSVWQYLIPAVQGTAGPGTGQVANVVRDLPRRIMRG